MGMRRLGLGWLVVALWLASCLATEIMAHSEDGEVQELGASLDVVELMESLEKDEKTKVVASKDEKPAKAASSGGKEKAGDGNSSGKSGKSQDKKAAEDPQTKELLKCTKQ